MHQLNTNHELVVPVIDRMDECLTHDGVRNVLKGIALSVALPFAALAETFLTTGQAILCTAVIIINQPAKLVGLGRPLPEGCTLRYQASRVMWALLFLTSSCAVSVTALTVTIPFSVYKQILVVTRGNTYGEPSAPRIHEQAIPALTAQPSPPEESSSPRRSPWTINIGDFPLSFKPGATFYLSAALIAGYVLLSAASTEEVPTHL